MTELSAYPAYKASRAKWLGAVPEHWTISPLGQYFRQRTGAVSDSDFAALSVTKQGIVPQLETAAKTDSGDRRKLVLAGDFAINSRSDRKGSSGISSHNGSVSLITTVITPHGLDSSFVHHLLRSEPFQEEYYRFGNGIVADLWSTRYSQMKSISLAVPPLTEQRQIAEYLDRETGQIDALITKQEQLVETLTERRQAVITQAVTRGLDPNVKLRASGLTWIASIPAHWLELPFIRVAPERVDYRGATPTKTEDGIQLVTARNVQSGRIDYESSKEYIAVDDYNVVMRRGVPSLGDILLTMEAPLGNVAIVDRTDVAFAQRVVKFRLDPRIALPEFVGHAMNSAYFQHELLSRATGSTALGIKASKLSELKIVIPPIDEQNRIAEFIGVQAGKIDRLTATAIAVVEVLKERRKALISAAVTGKIDVRGL